MKDEKSKKESAKKTSIKEKNETAVKKVNEKKESTKKASQKKQAIIKNSNEDKKQIINEKIKIDNKKENKIDLAFSLFEVILMIIITILSCILIFNLINKPTLDNKPENKNEVAEKEYTKDDIELFLEQYNSILNNFYGQIDEKQLLKSAIEGMLTALDPYSTMVDEESNSFGITLEGEYEGVGITIYNDQFGNIVIDSVYENTPASKAGILANDIIKKFNDKDLTNVSTNDLVQMIASTDEMRLTILRDGTEKELTLKREKIIINSVNYKMIDKKIGYIDIDIFANNTPEQFEKALKDLEKQNMKSLIIDLRDNTGGHLSSVEEMLYLFLDEKNIIYQTEDQNGTEKFYSKGNKNKKYNIVILQNGASASASEIMAAALKENSNAYIIGNTSFGKGTVQTLINVDSDTQYKVTTKIWKTPNGNWIEGVGISPNLEVNLKEEYYLNPSDENDDQLKAALDYLK